MFSIDHMSRCPVYEQLTAQVEKFILCGVLRAGDQLPSVRHLSVELSVNPNTIQKAYTELDARGLVCSVPGRGCFIAETATERLRKKQRNRLGELEALLETMRLADIPQEDILLCVETVYRKEHTL